MAFKRYDGVYSKSLQEKFDNEMATCPFCGDNPHWLLDLKSGLIKGTVTCMCEKCGAKLYTEGSISGWDDNLRIIEVGNRNINNLAVNSTYHIKTLGNIRKQIATSENDVSDAPQNTPASTFSDCTDNIQDSIAPTPVPADTQSNEAKKSSRKTKWEILGGAAIIILVVALTIFFSIRGCSPFEENKKKKIAEDAAVTLISDTLKSPSTAIWNEVSYLENNDDGLYIIYLDVEAQNSFGGYIRTKYFVIVYDINVKDRTFLYNKLFYRIECSGKDDTFNLNLIKSMNNYNGESNENSENYKTDEYTHKVMKKGAVIVLCLI